MLDARLQNLPVEACPEIVKADVPLSRDFSVHMLAARADSLLNQAAGAAGGKGAAADLAFEASDVAYIADPRNEDTGSSNMDKPRSTVLNNVDRLRGSPKLAGAWPEGARGDDHIPSADEVQELLGRRGAGGFVYYGPGKASACLPPADVAGLSIEGVRTAFLIDRADNDMTHRRQTKIDTQKTKAEMLLEGPVETAALWSLAGAGSLVCNQWATSFYANRLLLDRLLEGLGERGMSVGEAFKYAGEATEPPEDDAQSAPPPEAAAAEPDKGGAKGGKGGKGGGKKPATPKAGKKPASKPSTPSVDTPADDAAPPLTYQLKGRVRFCPALYGLPTFRMK